MSEALGLRTQDHAGKLAVVTHANRGLGRVIALHLATRGASILGTCNLTIELHNIDVLSHTVSSLYHSNQADAPGLKPVVKGLATNGSAGPQTAISDAVEREFGGRKVEFVIDVPTPDTEPGDITNELAKGFSIGQRLKESERLGRESRVVLVVQDTVSPEATSRFALLAHDIAGFFGRLSNMSSQSNLSGELAKPPTVERSTLNVVSIQGFSGQQNQDTARMIDLLVSEAGKAVSWSHIRIQ